MIHLRSVVLKLGQANHNGDAKRDELALGRVRLRPNASGDGELSLNKCRSQGCVEAGDNRTP